jgi:hypothetical protein
MLKPARWRKSIGTLASILCLIAWVGGGVILTRAAVGGLWQYPRFAEVLVYIVSAIASVGGLVWFWEILAQIEFWRRGYRVIQLHPKEYLRWSLGPKQWAYEERATDGRVLRFPFVRVILANGYPAPCELRFPNEKSWDAQAPQWARRRRAEILQRIVECVGGPKYARLADSE